MYMGLILVCLLQLMINFEAIYNVNQLNVAYVFLQDYETLYTFSYIWRYVEKIPRKC